MEAVKRDRVIHSWDLSKLRIRTCYLRGCESRGSRVSSGPSTGGLPVEQYLIRELFVNGTSGQPKTSAGLHVSPKSLANGSWVNQERPKFRHPDSQLQTRLRRF